MGMHIGHIALQVEDIDRSVEHASDTLGLNLRTGGGADGAALLSANEKHHELQLIPSSRAGMDHIGLEVETEAEIEAIKDRAVAAGGTVLSEEPEEPALRAALRIEGPADLVFEVYCGMEREPLSLDSVLRPAAQKLGHVTLFSDQKTEIEGFMTDAFGFRVSDRLGDHAVWMRCDPDHHSFAIGRVESGGTRLHHYAWELESWSSVLTYADRLAREGQQLLWGPGRHGPGFNIYTYLLDPAGAIVEAYADLLQIDNDEVYEAIDWSDEPRALNLWGPEAPAGFNDHGVPILGPS
jgi:catechol-2,3-dioxygenase